MTDDVTITLDAGDAYRLLRWYASVRTAWAKSHLSDERGGGASVCALTVAVVIQHTPTA